MSKDVKSDEIQLQSFPQKQQQSNIYIQAATSDHTRRAYQQGIKHYLAWGGLLPASSSAIVQYLHYFADKLNTRSLAHRLVALKTWHLHQGFADPTAHALVRKTLAGIQRVHGKPKEKAPAITLADLKAMSTFLESRDSLAAIRNNALFLVGFFGALRRSELTKIEYEHVSWSPDGIEILIPRSKTDPQREGQSCAIPYGDDTLCAVKALKEWLTKANITSGYIFRSISRTGIIGKSALSVEALNFLLKATAEACNLTYAKKVSGHSLRRGFATEASKKGASLINIMRHGRWKDERTVFGYIEEGQRFNENAANVLINKE